MACPNAGRHPRRLRREARGPPRSVMCWPTQHPSHPAEHRSLRRTYIIPYGPIKRRTTAAFAVTLTQLPPSGQDAVLSIQTLASYSAWVTSGPFHPQVQAIRDRLEAESAPPLYTLPIEQARARDVKGALSTAGTLEPVAHVSDFVIPGEAGDLAARIYRFSEDGALPAVVYFFGGGWSLGTLDTSDAVCRMITNRAKCVSIAVSYRLAPEHKFPAAVLDCYRGISWVAEHGDELGIDQERIAVGGDSSGGNLAAAVALLAKERGGPRLIHQLLVYPNTDAAADTDSMREITDELFFNIKSVKWYWGMYLNSAEDAPTRWHRRCGQLTFPACRPPRSLPRSLTRFGTSPSCMPDGWPSTAFPRKSSATPA